MSMQITRWRGLSPDTNPNIGADGGMVEAENLVSRVPGALEPRDGLRAHVVTDLLDTIENLAPYRGAAMVASSTRTWLVEGSPPATTELQFSRIGDGATDVALWPEYLSALSYRGGLHLATQMGLVRALNPSAFTAAPQSVSPGGWGIRSAVPAAPAGRETWFPDTFWISYRFTTFRVDENGVEWESAPSPAFLVQNTLGVDASQVTLSLSWPYDFPLSGFFPDPGTSDKIRVYRAISPVPTETSGSDFALAVSRALSTIVDGGTITDRVSPDNLGAALYTNPGQERESRATERAPIGRQLSLGNGGSLYLANITTHASDILQLSTSAMATPPGPFTVNPTITSDEVQMTSTTGLQVGMLLTGTSDAFLDRDVWIVAVLNSTTVQVSEAAADSTNFTATFYHGLGVSDSVDTSVRWYRLHAPTFMQAIAGRNFLTVGLTPTFTNEYSLNGPEEQVEVTDLRAVATGGDDLIYARIQARSPGRTVTIRVNAAVGAGVISPSGLASGEVLQGEDSPGRIVASRPYSPTMWFSGVPGVDALDVGNPYTAILGVAWVEGRGYVFKPEGIFVLTGGEFPTPLSATPLSDNYRLMSPRHLCVAGDQVVAWTDRGVISVGPQGVQDLSNLVIDQRFEGLRFQHDGVDYIQAYGGNMCHDRTHNEVHLYVQSTTPAVSEHLVFNLDTGVWTSWSSAAGVLALGVDGLTHLSPGDRPAGITHYRTGTGSTGLLWQAMDPEELDTALGGWDNYIDRGLQATTISTVVDLGSGLFSFLISYTLATGMATPQVGDAVYLNSGGTDYWALILAVTAGPTLASVTSAYCPQGMVTGSGSIVYSYPLLASTLPIAVPDIGQFKHWTAQQWVLQRDPRGKLGLYSPKLQTTSSQSDTPYIMPRFPTGYTQLATQRPISTEARVGRAHQKSSHLNLSMSIREAGARFLLTGLVLWGEGVDGSMRTTS